MKFRASILVVVPLFVWVGCGSSDDSSGAGPGGGGSGGTDGGVTFIDAGSSEGGTTLTTPDGGTLHAGSVSRSCTAGIPASGAPADVSHPTTKVGSGTAASCTFDATNAAISAGGIVTFDCGPDPVTIQITATMNLPTDKDTVIDGGGKVTFDGNHAVQILNWNSANFDANEHRLTLQHLSFVNAKTTPKDAIPKADPPCSQGFDDGEGGALYMRDGNLTVIDCIFAGNEAALLGPDTGGGAFYIVGSKHGALVVRSTFSGNSAANGGGIGSLFSELDVYDSLLTGNTGTGHDANSIDNACAQINNNQHEVGSGGNGGALYNDGAKTDPPNNTVHNIVLCGDEIEDNAAGTNAFGGGIFFTSNDYSGTLTITDSTISGNTGGHWTNVQTGSVTNAGDAVGTNAKSITITNSSVQGVP